jgi:hypothetical protein
MNENDINNLLNDSLGRNTARQDFKERLLQNSTKAFTQVRIFHNRLKVTGLIFLIAAITTVAFYAGRFSAIENTSNQPLIVQQSNTDDNNISVSKDLVVWLDAAKFFTQLGMADRAEFSYKQASQLIPQQINQNDLVGTGQNIELADILENYDKQNPRVSEQEQKAILEITNKILAQNFGD